MKNHSLYFCCLVFVWLSRVSSTDVFVTYLVDTVGNASKCSPSDTLHNGCNIRSAFSFCALHQSSISQCRIMLPVSSIVQMKSSLGPVDAIFSESVDLILEGAGATVTLDMASRHRSAPKSGLARLVGDATRMTTFTVRDVSFTYFSDSVFNIKQITFDLKNAQFQNNAAYNGESKIYPYCMHVNSVACCIELSKVVLISLFVVL